MCNLRGSCHVIANLYNKNSIRLQHVYFQCVVLQRYLHKYHYVDQEMEESEIGEISANMTASIKRATRRFQENNIQYGLKASGMSLVIP